jgi:hypothetical protein
MHIYAAKLETHHITLLVPDIMHFMKQSWNSPYYFISAWHNALYEAKLKFTILPLLY